jgi:hypothetical protein
MEKLKRHRKIAFDLDGTLVDGVASREIAEFIRDNPEKTYYIVTFRIPEQCLHLNEELAQVGLKRADFQDVVPMSKRFVIEFEDDQAQRRFANLPPPKTVDHMLPGERRYVHWKGFVCSRLGATALIDDMPEMSAPGCKQHNIALEDPLDFVRERVSEKADWHALINALQWTFAACDRRANRLTDRNAD